MTVHTLAYLGIDAPDLGAWRAYATDVLAMQAVDQTDDLLRLRMDDKHHRFAVYRADKPGLRHTGWDVGNKAELDRLTSAYAELGHPAQAGSAEECKERQVVEMRALTDPSGNRVELFYGQKSGFAFDPARQFGGFKTGALGLGHVVFMTNVLDAMLAFYEVLGFRMSDYIHIKPVQARAYFMHLNARHHSLALIAGPHNVFHHTMIEVNDLDDVGMANEIAQRRGLNLTMTLGKHTNDRVVSFYTQTPSGFELEYGTGGVTIDDEESWQVVEYDDISFWGHLGPMREAV